MNALRLFAVSALILLSELVFIRYLGTEIPAVGFFKNLLLVAAFLGLGVGLNLKWSVSKALPLAALTALLPTVLVKVSVGRRLVRSYSGLGEGEAVLVGQLPQADQVLGIALLCLAFLMTALPFVFLGRLLGAYFDAYRQSLRAYGWNIVGSLAGTVLFSGLCVLSIPPLMWFGVSSLLLTALVISEFASLGAGRAGLTAALAGLQLVLTIPSAERREVWTPYYKVTLFPMSYNSGLEVGHGLEVNNVWFQESFDMSYLRRREELTEQAAHARNLRFLAPFELARPRSVLVLGSGLGNDTASAVQFGAESVDAVDIDGQIIRLAEEFHPNRPYRDPRVRTVIDDARHYLTATDRTYDLILFGVLEARALFSQFANLRLDNFVYTREGLRAAKERLAPGGVLWINMWVPKVWVLEKFVKLMKEEFRDQFAILHGVGSAHFSFVTSDRLRPEQIAAMTSFVPGVRLIEEDQIRRSGQAVTVPTDDWPYDFFRSRGLPVSYLLLLGALILISLVPLRLAYRELFRVEWGFFFLGAAFLLLETNAVTRIALLAGTTWLVNSAVFAGVLVFILLANWAAAGGHFRRPASLFVCLGLSLLVSFAFPYSRLLSLPNGWAITAGAAVLTWPILFAGMIFSTYLRGASVPSRALGSNVFGAVMGGLAEYFSMLLGNRAMTLVALGLYLLAWHAFRRARVA